MQNLQKDEKDYLDKLREEYETLAGDWNGEDPSFQSGGEIYHEEDAGIASEIVEKIDELKELLANFNG